MSDRAALEKRKSFLGASEVAAVCGIDPFKSALDVWASKKGLIMEAQSIAADMGNLFERPAEPDGEFMAAMPPCTNERHSGEV